jgi:exodeoxyribonuclease V alpha subunit
MVRSKLLDRTMLYTAITRGIETVVLVGDLNLSNEIIEAAPASLQRTTALRFDES